MTAADTRRENARAIAKEVGGPKAFADRLGMSTSQCSQIIGTRPIRDIGPRLARKIEAEFGRPEGWLDAPHGVAPSGYGGRATNGDLDQIAEAWGRLSPSQRAYYREAIFRDAAIGAVMPWLSLVAPASPRYVDFERSVEMDFAAKVRQLSLFKS